MTKQVNCCKKCPTCYRTNLRLMTIAVVVAIFSLGKPYYAQVLPNNNANIRTIDPSSLDQPDMSNLPNNEISNKALPNATLLLVSDNLNHINLTLDNPQCDYNWHRFDDKCYYFLGTQSSHTFEEARYECSKYFRGTLATIKSEAEQKFVESILKGTVIYNNVWLGSKWLPETIDSRSGYYWVDGTPVTYHNKLLYPDLSRGNKTSMCLAMFMHTQYFGIWTPFNCNYYFHVLCQRNLRLESGSSAAITVNQLNYSSIVSLIMVLYASWIPFS